MLTSIMQDESGMVSTEYALLLAVVVLTGLATWVALGAPTRSTVGTASNGWPPAG
jgi:Flp pilus assembly pilin Flp